MKDKQARRRATCRYRLTNKYREAQKRYRRSANGKSVYAKTKAMWLKTEKGRAYLKRQYALRKLRIQAKRPPEPVVLPIPLLLPPPPPSPPRTRFKLMESKDISNAELDRIIRRA